MADPAFSLVDDSALVALFADRLAESDAALSSTRPILRHLLGHDDHALLSDRIVAAVRGQLRDVAFQLIVAVETAAGRPEPGGPEPREVAEKTCDSLALALAAQPVMLGHAHALAVEAELAEGLSTRLGLDSVLSPHLQALIASNEPATSTGAMQLLAAQARFGQTQRRCELPLGELPGDLLHTALIVMRTWVGNADPARDAQAAAAERAIRAGFDEAASRLGLLHRLVAGMGGGAIAALDLAHGGVALFATALALGSGQERDHAVLVLSEGQLPRLALTLLACGLKSAAVEAQCLALHPDLAMPAGFEHLHPDRAAALLGGADR